MYVYEDLKSACGSGLRELQLASYHEGMGGALSEMGQSINTTCGWVWFITRPMN